MIERPNIEWCEQQMGSGGAVPPDKVRALIEWIKHLEGLMRASAFKEPRWFTDEELREEAIKEAVEAERRACASIADAEANECAKYENPPDGGAETETARLIAESIRARR